MPATGYFDVTLVPDEWFDETVVATSWYDDTIDALVALAPSAQASATATAFVTAPAVGIASAASVSAAVGSLTVAAQLSATGQAVTQATATVSILGSTAYSDLILGETGLVSYWRLDESSGNALDSKDSNPGTTFGANVTRNVSGLITNSTNAATAGDGSTADWITVPSSSNMDVGTRLTVEFWCRPAALPAVPAYLVDRGTDGPFWIRHYATGDGRWEFNVKDSSLVRISFTGGAGTAAQAGVLQHIVMTYDAVAGAMKGYVNGVAVGTGAPAPTLPVNSGGILCLLNRTSGFAGGFNGTLDEVALYNVALTPVQILTHYLTGIGTPALIPKATATAAATAAIIAPGPATVTPVAQASAAAAARITTAAYPNRILGETGLVSYWRLGEASGNALDAKDSNPAVQQGTAMVRNVPGLLTTNIDAAAQNDGSAGSYFEAAYAANMNVGNAITVECWVKLSAYVNGRIIVARESANVCWMLKEATSTGYQWVVRDANGVDTLVAVVPNSLVVGAVQHLVGVYDGAGGRCELWVNGVSVGTPGRTPNANVRDSTSQPLHIGGDSFFGDMAGVIDEVALYNVALTPAQITNHYLAGSDTPALAPTAVATSVAVTALSAAAVLAVAASAVSTGTVVLSAPALLAPSAAAVTQASAAATAAAVLTAAATALAQATATTTAPSQLTAAAMTIATATATLTATGAAFLTPTATATGVASLAATAPTLLTAATAAVTLATGATTASAQLAATATGIGTASASLSAPVQLAATATGMGAASTSLSAPAKLVAAATGSGAAIALLSAPASLTATATTLASATETLTAPSVVTSAAQAIAAATAISTAPTRVTAAATAVAQASLALTAGGIALSAAATGLAGASTTVTTTAPLVASGQAIGLAAATLTTTPALTPVATAVTQAAAALTARAMLTAAAVAPAGASALVSSGAIAIAGTAQAVAASTAALTAPSSLAANATGLATAVSFVTASPMITPQATTTASATTALRVTMGVSGAAQALSAAQLASLRVGQSLQANATGVARATLTIGLAGSLYPVARAVSAASTTVTAPPYGKVHLLIGTSVALTLVLGDTTAYDLKTVTTTTPELALRESSAYDLQIKATTARDETVSTH
jgi:trimeric autotransporter adhesin